jgi:NitT/TauT family transport system substrate-binding protein
LASTLRKEADDAKSVGLLQNTNLTGLVNVGPLNTVLKAAGKPTVTG